MRAPLRAPSSDNGLTTSALEIPGVGRGTTASRDRPADISSGRHLVPRFVLARPRYNRFAEHDVYGFHAEGAFSGQVSSGQRPGRDGRRCERNAKRKSQVIPIMASISLSNTERRRLLALIASHGDVGTVARRYILLEDAGLRRFETRLSMEATAADFSAELVRVLQDFGTERETGQPALVSLLRVLREKVEGQADALAFVDGLLAPYQHGGDATASGGDAGARDRGGVAGGGGAPAVGRDAPAAGVGEPAAGRGQPGGRPRGCGGRGRRPQGHGHRRRASDAAVDRQRGLAGRSPGAHGRTRLRQGDLPLARAAGGGLCVAVRPHRRSAADGPGRAGD